MEHVIVGTAGHVDHGKTALVKALTGIDTDRLKEEKERGITIDIGFAHLTLPDGKMIGIIDVPGHERFIRNMVAGASGIDCVILVVAADEGVMPQTREHLAICTLLGVRRGIIALTKVDLVDKDWLAMVREDVVEFTRGTFLAEAPIVAVSSTTGEGMVELLRALEECVNSVEAQYDIDIFRLPVDRVFTIKGFGTVLTGSVASGRIFLGEEVVILPKGLKGKVRGLQSYGLPVDKVARGQRAAINVQGIDRHDVERGDVVGPPGMLVPTFRLDVHLQILPTIGQEIKNRQIVRLHIGTSEVMARVVLIGREVLKPGDTSFAQFFLEKPTVTVAGDRFVIRSYSPITTLGGGEILDPMPRKYRRIMKSYEEELATVVSGPEEAKVKVMINRGGWVGANLRDIVIRTGISATRLKPILEKLGSSKEAFVMEEEEKRYVARSFFELLQKNIVQEVETYHQKNPMKAGISKEELRQLIGKFIPLRLFVQALWDLEKAGSIVIERDLVRAFNHRVSLGKLEELQRYLETRYLKAGLTPPTKREILEENASTKETELVLEIMLKEGSLIKVNEELFFHRNVIDKLREDYRALLVKEGKATPLSFKEMTGLSRKFIIPLMEYFDLEKLTIRTGDYRILRNRR
ncbi:MAG: selenocysteine-specific translation elongation factor [Syntrophales bacterium]|nr:selenocysteine-specific translation elongation factor [Syntrophales bacterium]